MMLKTVEGIYRQGKIQLIELPLDIQDNTRVIVTFLAPKLIDLTALGVDEDQARDLRARLQTFIEDWERPEMDAYDDYDTAVQI
jgi:hypothetical protein